MHDQLLVFTKLLLLLIIFFRYPYDEAATIAISTVKESSDGLKEVGVNVFLSPSNSQWNGGYTISY